jgi:hypothetical protein
VAAVLVDREAAARVEGQAVGTGLAVLADVGGVVTAALAEDAETLRVLKEMNADTFEFEALAASIGFK